MTLAVVFRNAARFEFDLAALRYDMQRPGLGAEFVAEIDRAVRAAATYPHRFSVKHADVRRVPVRRFPYPVFYRVEPARIVVLAVFHGRQDPNTWQTRSQ
jgi:plasmid stabilization system protein ParE